MKRSDSLTTLSIASLSSLLGGVVFGTSIAVAQQPLLTHGGEFEPAVPAVSTNRVEEATFEGGRVELDGMSCIKCTFKNVVITYSGGQYLLVNPQFEKVSIVLKGAALNTLALQQYIATLNAPRPSKPRPDPKANPKVPIKFTIAKTDTSIDLISPGLEK